MAAQGRNLFMVLAVVLSTGLPVLGHEPTSSAVVAAVEGALVDAIAGASPSIVAISQVRKRSPGETLNFEIRPGPLGMPVLPHQLPRPEDADFIPTEYATGVVVDRRGLVLTAYHALQRDCEFFVTTHQHKRYRAWIKAADPRSDLAVLTLEADDLVPIRLGDASELRRGQFVIAMGNPYAVARDGQASASWGIVANLNRKAPPTPTEADSAGKTTLHHFGTLIQTDAKLNLGTSGGALLDLKGRMVGLTTSLAAVSGYETAAGYAYPVDEMFRRVIETLKRGREVEYGFLGIEPAGLSEAEVRQGLQGIRVERVEPGARAETFGLKIDDIVTAVNGRPIYSTDDLVREVGQLPVEATAKLSVQRDGRERTIDVTLSKYPVRGHKVVTSPKPSWRGLQVEYTTAIIDPEIRKAAGMKFFDDRVVVIDVEADSPAWSAGLRPGTLITHVGRRAVRTPAEFDAAVADEEGDVRLRTGGPMDRKTADLVVPEA
jgi:serine protease Do